MFIRKPTWQHRRDSKSVARDQAKDVIVGVAKLPRRTNTLPRKVFCAKVRALIGQGLSVSTGIRRASDTPRLWVRISGWMDLRTQAPLYSLGPQSDLFCLVGRRKPPR